MPCIIPCQQNCITNCNHPNRNSSLLLLSWASSRLPTAGCGQGGNGLTSRTCCVTCHTSLSTYLFHDIHLYTYAPFLPAVFCLLLTLQTTATSTKSDNLCKMIHKSKSSQLTAKKVTHTFPSDLFLEDGSWDPNTKRAHCARSRPLRERMGIMGRVEDSEPREFSKEEMSCLEDLLRGMMVYEPTERMTTKNAIASEWMRKYVPTSGSQAG